ncbi:metallophosphoesterase [Maricaulis sp. D1M11]|uniref:metallophosphoesterase n=1 Tax=Maricaulis sp. D1M11 TaxID=3076117 RepID=UPI0039B39B99
MTRLIVILLATWCGLAAPSWAHPDHWPQGTAPWDTASDWPDRIIMTPADDPATTLTLVWRTSATVSESVAELAPATAAAQPDLASHARNARIERVDLDQVAGGYGRPVTRNFGRGPVHYHTVTFRNLQPDTPYLYRVRGARGHWSEWFQVKTAPQSGPVTFLYYGDAQRGVHSHWSRIIRQGLLTAPEAEFVLHAGDLVNQGDRDTEWAEWHAAGGFFHAMRNVIPVAGNHEYTSTGPGGYRNGEGAVTALWRPQFTLPEEEGLPDALVETVYDVRYTQDLHIFVLDSSSPDWDAQLDWFDETARASDARWKIVSMHHSPFRPGGANNPTLVERRDSFVRLARRHDVAMVLAGHNHSYTRASFGTGMTARTLLGEARDVEMVIAVSVSGGMTGRGTGPAYMESNHALADELTVDRWGNNTPTFQSIRIDGDQLVYTAYTALGQAYDAFTLTRDADGNLRLVDGEAAFGDIRQLETTEPYAGNDHLR